MTRYLIIKQDSDERVFIDPATPILIPPENVRTREQLTEFDQGMALIPPPQPHNAAPPASASATAQLSPNTGQSSSSPDFASCLIPASLLETMHVPKRPRLLCKWLCEGDLGYVFAGRGVGKTWLAMALPAAISQGTALGEWEPGDVKARVLYVDGEMPLELTQYRSRGMKLGEGDVVYLHHETLFDRLGTSLNIGLAEHRAALTALIVDQNFKLLILDNLSSLASGVDENKGFDYENIASWLLELRRRKITVIVVHHAGRNGLMRGHSKREDALSWILELRDAKAEGEEGAKFISHFAKPSRNTGDSMPDLLWHFTTTDGCVSIRCEQAQVSEYEAFIQHVLDGVERQADIAELMNKPKGTVSKWAHKAVRDRRIQRVDQKLLPPKPPTEA